MKYLWAALITIWLAVAVYFYLNLVLFHRFFGKAGQKKKTAPQNAEKYNDYERINITAADEMILTAKLFTPESGDGEKSVLLCHDYKTNGEADFEKEFKLYESLGYNILMIEQRCHGKSMGEVTTLGMVEGYDALSWCKWLELRFGTGCPIVVHGKGMGGFATVMCMASPDLPQNVEMAVAEKVYDCVFDVFLKWTEEKYGFLKKLIVPVVNMFYRHNTGFDMRDADLKRFAKKISVPVLFVNTDKNSVAFKTTKTAVSGVELKKYLDRE